MGKTSFVLIASFATLCILRSNGQVRGLMNPNSFTTDNQDLWECIGNKICQCGQENEFRNCTNQVKDESVRLLLDWFPACFGIEDRDNSGPDGRWICADPESSARRCGEQVTNVVLNRELGAIVIEDVREELTEQERGKEVESVTKFFPCFINVILSCRSGEPQC